MKVLFLCPSILPPLLFQFQYDNANRLLGSTRTNFTETEQDITYDLNDTIKTLKRYKAGNMIDELVFNYGSNGDGGNRLTTIQDNSGNQEGVKAGSSSFTYDSNGNLKNDGAKGVTITYNYLNLPQSITKGNKTYTYLYDASGKKHSYSGDTLNIKYAGVLEYGTNNTLKRVSGEAGQMSVENDSIRFEYYLKDHLGNVRTVFNEKGDILQQTDYYAFGLAIPRDNPAQSENNRNGVNRYLYNEKELQVGTGYLDYGARMYMPEIGRWGVVDPLADHPNQLGISPYAFCNNAPVNMKDDDGRLPNPIIGALIGAGVDYGFQVVGNLARGKGLGQSLIDVDYRSIGISAGAGALSSGLSAFGTRATQFAVSTGIDATESVLKQANEGQSITLSQTVSDVASNKVGGVLTRNAGNVVDTKVLSKEASRTARVSANDPSSSGRAARAETAKAALTKAETTNQVVGTTVSGVAGNAIQNTSNATRAQSTSNRSYSAPTNTAQSDATRVYKPLILERQ